MRLPRLIQNTCFAKVCSISLCASLILGACSTPPTAARLNTQGHLNANQLVTPSDIPPLTEALPLPPPPQSVQKMDTYSVVVNRAEVADLLFALARDARLNIDIDPDVSGNVTLNAVDQTLPQILARIAKQVDLRYEIQGNNLSIMRDTPFLQQYRIDYVNMSRDTGSTVSIATQIASTGRAPAASGINASSASANLSLNASSSASSANNNSLTQISSRSNNHFWDTLVNNLRDLLRETDKVLPEGSSETTIEQSSSQSTTGTGNPAPMVRNARGVSAPPSLATSPNPATLQGSGTTVTRRMTFREAAAVIANPEGGLITVRATARQHEKVQEFIDTVLHSARRQVLIEATVVEVQLNEQYQQGINWQSMTLTGRGFTATQQPGGTAPLFSGVPPNAGPGGINFATDLPFTNIPFAGAVNTGAANPSLLTLRYLNATSSLGNIAAAISLLESFGTVKVLSSPKISALNNQSAILKVVDNKVYFTIEVTVTPPTNNSVQITTYNTTLNTVPVGFVMTVTPYIDANGMVILNVRPTISRIIGYALDPSPALAAAQVTSRIPEIQTREMESILQVPSGQIAVMGGLIQDALDNRDDAVPGAGQIPILGKLFKYQNHNSSKSELVVFIRPVVIDEPNLPGAYRSYQALLPKKDFFSSDSVQSAAALPKLKQTIRAGE